MIADRRERTECLSGQPIRRAASPDGRWAYTLYRNVGGELFIHALDTVGREAVCIDLDWKGSQVGLWRVRLAVSRDGSRLLLRSRGGRVVMAVSAPRALAPMATGPPRWRTFRARGVSVRYPPGWYATARPLTFVSYPPQVLAVGSYPLPRDRSGANGCQPKEALDRMPVTGALVYGWEYARPSPVGGIRVRDFPIRPRRFTLTGHAQYECLGPSYMLRFREAGRLFQIHVVMGQKAGPATRAKVLRILDSFRTRRT